jgi:hypothetical protein
MARPQGKTHVLLRKPALQQIRAMYPNVSADAVWRVEVANGGYGRDALHLVRVDGLGGPELDERIVVWRGQVVGFPRCDYCGLEGHSTSKGTAAVCPVRRKEAEEERAAQSARMKARWERLRAEAAEMSGQAGSTCSNVEPAGADPGPVYSSPGGESPF